MMLALGLLTAAFLLFWLWIRVCYYVLRQPSDNFWRFSRRSLLPGASNFVLILDTVIKGVAIFYICLIFETLWQRF